MPEGPYARAAWLVRPASLVWAPAPVSRGCLRSQARDGQQYAAPGRPHRAHVAGAAGAAAAPPARAARNRDMAASLPM